MYMRFSSVALATLLVSGAVASAQTTLNDPQNFAWDIQHNNWGEIINGTSDAYDFWPQLCVTTNLALTGHCTTTDTFDAGGVSGTFELGGRQIVTTTRTLSGLQVFRKIYVPNTGTLGFARYMNVLDNPGATAVTVKVRMGTADGQYCNLGSDTSTLITATSDGTGTLGPNLLWFTSDDASNGSGDPSLAHVIGGVNAPVPVANARHNTTPLSSDEIDWEYIVTVPAGGRIIVMHFESQQPNRASADAAGVTLSDPLINPDAIFGITSEELGVIVNFGAGSGLEDGSFCFDGPQCLSGNCIDGRCCDNACGGGNDDCMACSQNAGAAMDGVCGVVAMGVECRAAASVCDQAEMCDGVSMACPVDDVAPAGIECREAVEDCDGAETCDGVSPDCPPDDPAPAGAMCRPRSAPCDAIEYCDGVSRDCPDDELESAGTSCRDTGDECDMAEMCDGMSSECPINMALPDGTPCGDDDICNGEDTCRAGFCQTAVPPPNCCTANDQCDDGDPCTDDSCDMAANSCVSVANTACIEPPPPPPEATGCCSVADRPFPASSTLFWTLIIGALWLRRRRQLGATRT